MALMKTSKYDNANSFGIKTSYLFVYNMYRERMMKMS